MTISFCKSLRECVKGHRLLDCLAIVTGAHNERVAGDGVDSRQPENHGAEGGGKKESDRDAGRRGPSGPEIARIVRQTGTPSFRLHQVRR